MDRKKRGRFNALSHCFCIIYVIEPFFFIPKIYNLWQIWAKSEKGPPPSPYGATIRALIQAAFCMGLYVYLVPHFPLTIFTDPVYQEWGFWKRLGYQYMCGFTARWKYYFIWSISEAAVIISGLGFSGWTESSPPKPKWDRAKNVDILGVELAKSAVTLPLVWNIQVSTWLRYCEFLSPLNVSCLLFAWFWSIDYVALRTCLQVRDPERKDAWREFEKHIGT